MARNKPIHKTRTRIIIGILILFFLVTFFLVWRREQVRFYKDPSTTGNTSGNLLNGGLFTQYEDRIYFANPYDQNTLYSMNDQLENVKKIYNDNASYINVAGDYIFYTRRNDKKANNGDALLALSTTGLFRITTKGTHSTKLYDNPTQVATLYGNNVYYQHYDDKKGLLLYSAKIDGSTDKEILNEGAAPYVVYENEIFYTGQKSNHQIHSMNLDGSNPKILYDGNCTALTMQGSYLYFLDMEQDYALVRIDLDGSNPTLMVDTRLATYNAAPDGKSIFYQVDNGTDNGLYRLNTETMASTLIESGNFNYLNLTNDYLFYEDYIGKNLFILDLATNEHSQFQP